MDSLVILANGDFPSAARPLEVLRSADYVVCCDGAAAGLIAAGMEPDAVVGDLDSIGGELRERLGGRLHHVSDQETNDLTKAFNFAMSLSPARITVLGATGKREDHTLANISLLLDYARRASCPVTMITDHGEFRAISDTSTIRCRKGCQVSLFSFDSTLKIESAGLLYPTGSVVFDSLWKASLNEAGADEFTLTLSHPSGVLVFLADDL